MAAAPQESSPPACPTAPRGAATGPAQAGLIGRGIGVVFIAAGATGLLSVSFPPARYGSPGLAAIVAAQALVTGVVLLAFRRVAWSVRADRLVLALATATVSVGVYAGGAPASGAMFFYLWVIPYAFAVLSRRDAVAQAAWMAACSAAVLVIQVDRHPGIGSPAELAGMWLIAVATVFAVGTLVRGLSRSLRDADRRFKRAFQDSQVGAAFVSMDGRWLDVNDALCRMLGRSRRELVGASLLDITVEDDRDATTQAVAFARDGAVHYEKRYLRPDGQIICVEVFASPIAPEVGAPYLFGQYRDITAHKRDREALAHQAVHDPLTGLVNRTLLLDRLETALARGDSVAVILLDIDGFKFVNDSLGHQTGDEVLTVIAPRLAAATDPTDTLGRLGGDEFVVLCERLHGPLDAIDRASRLCAALTTPVALATGRHTLTASIGIATSNGPPDTAHTLLRDADAAMYRAKAKGRGRIELFDQTMREEALERLQLEHDLQLAIEQHEFVLEYQPIVNTHTLQPVAFEALVRWDHPTRGRLGPALFIPLAEDTGLITQIGAWVLDTACAQLADWQNANPNDHEIQVAVNVSPAQLAVEGFVDNVARVLRRTMLAPGSLCLEITETAILSDEAPTAALAALKALGVRILLDDFGTGYSSLAYLSRYPIDTLKIDRAFVNELDGAAHNSAITKAILAIAHELRLGIVAEGVETRAQLKQLRGLNCPHIQGHAVSRPLAAEDVLAYLAHQPRHLRLTQTA